MARKTPSQRIEEYRRKADALAAREARRILRKSPQWVAHLRAREKIDEALILIAAQSEQDRDHIAALDAAAQALDTIALQRILL
jgi:hypothetical protein